MARFKLESAIGELTSLYFNYDTATLGMVSATASKVEVADINGDTVVYNGTGLTVESGDATAGRVTSIEFLNGNGDLLLTISDASYKFADITLTTVQHNFSLFEKGNDTFTGSSRGDIIMYADNIGNDTIRGLGGDDYIIGSAGRNTFDGGKGTDVLTWEPVLLGAGTKGVKVDLSEGTAINPWGQKDKLVSIEDVRGTGFADTFVGSGKNDHFGGQGGNDTYTGGKGNDQFDFGLGGGRDKITDFGKGDDSVELSNLGVGDFRTLKGMMDQVGKNVVIDFGNGDRLTFLDVQKGDFASSDFTIYDWN